MKKFLVITVFIIVVVILGLYLTLNVYNKPEITVYINGRKEVLDVKSDKYDKTLTTVNEGIRSSYGLTKSEMDKEEAMHIKRRNSIEVVYSRVTISFKKFFPRLEMYRRALVPINEEYESDEIFTCIVDYSSGGLSGETMNYSFLFN